MEEKYFLEEKRNGDIELYEKDGTFYNHNTQDLLIAILYDKDKAEKILSLLENDSLND